MGLRQSPYNGTHLVGETNGMAHLPGWGVGGVNHPSEKYDATVKLDHFPPILVGLQDI